MRIQQIGIQNVSINCNSYSDVSFSAKGNPITLSYIVETRSKILPQRVLDYAKNLLKISDTANLPSLLEIHKKLYAPLLNCKTLEEAQNIFPEFSHMTDKVVYKRKSVYAQNFQQKTNKSFALTMLQEHWANLKTKDEIAKSLGMTSRTSLDWPLQQIGFISYGSNYRTLLNASDAEGNNIIAAKTIAWNSAHPDLVRKKNKIAAQGCKTDKYREEQSARMKEYDKEHPERKEKISRSLRNAWAKCPEIRQTMTEALNETPYIKQLLTKQNKGIPLKENERISLKSFYKKFWDSHPEFKPIYSEARKTKNSP